MSDSNTTPSSTPSKPSVDDSSDSSDETEDIRTEYDPPLSPCHTSTESMDPLITFKRMSDSNTRPSLTLTKPSVDDSSDSSDDPEDLSTEYDPPLSPRHTSTESMDPLITFKRSLPSKIAARSQLTETNLLGVLVRTHSSSSYESGKSSNDSGAPSIISFKYDQSMDRPNTFKSELHNALMIEECLKCSLCKNVMKDPVSIPCGDTFCKTCIQKHLNEDCSCPNCSKRFEIFPDLPLNKTLDRLLKQMDFSHALPAHSYAGPGDVACDICTGKKIRAAKSCLTCGVSYCETHVRHHYTVEAFSHHVLVDATKDLKQNICQQDTRSLDEFILPINKVTAKVI